MLIGSKRVDADSPVYFIADVGANHDGDLVRAKELIRLAASAGADACKFQHFQAKSIVSQKGFNDISDFLPDHQKSWKKSVVDVYKDAEINLDWDLELFSCCKEHGIEYMTSPYSLELLSHISSFVDTIKIGSGDITWHQLIEAACKTKKNILFATGASTLQEVKLAYDIITRHDLPHCIMQCNTNYTGSIDNMQYCNLNVLKHYRDIFPAAVLGLSDHTPGFITVLGAVALGAKVIEKHFTDDKSRTGPDHAFAMDPDDWTQMVDCTRLLEKSLGDGIKKVENNEERTYIVQRRSIYARKDLMAGDIITQEDVECLRPQQPGSLFASSLSDIIGKKLLTNISNNDCLFPSAFEHA